MLIDSEFPDSDLKPLSVGEKELDVEAIISDSRRRLLQPYFELPIGKILEVIAWTKELEDVSALGIAKLFLIQKALTNLGWVKKQKKDVRDLQA
jgi:hypothetical protein